MVRDLPRLKLIYVMRHPIERLMSQYVHELTAGRIAVGLREALGRHPELIDYSRYSMQLQPFVEAYGPGTVLPVFFSRLVTTRRRSWSGSADSSAMRAAAVGRRARAAEPGE